MPMWPACWTRRVQLSRTPLSGTHLHKLLSVWRLHCGVLGYHKKSSFFCLALWNTKCLYLQHCIHTFFFFFLTLRSYFGNSSFWSAYCQCASLNVFSAGAHIPLWAPLGHFVYKKTTTNCQDIKAESRRTAECWGVFFPPLPSLS